ncbi:MAG: hypothetical protein K0R26_860 [Bacteroidota bacterium]|jgi:redox-sensitive bicupin YhaK (pirin superfamily)|nr:hypothetical protein [Bacteroidota bacterium]
MNAILNIKPLGFQWETQDPFLFCVHHEDTFPPGNANMGLDKKYLTGRSPGDDFITKDGFRMYHGKSVPGFPGHPHKGFETITIVRKGIVDHADSLGAAGRYGDGDVQWMTAGKGVLHSEMFPLIHADRTNSLELFQIWLNLPRKSKQVEPHFKMFWKESIPVYVHNDNNGKNTHVEIIAGSLFGINPPTPPPDSWASDPQNEVGVWNLKMDADSSFTIPKAAAGINRTIYFYSGTEILINGTRINSYHAVEVNPEAEILISAIAKDARVLILQGRPINEPVVQYGPFVMNSKAEINEAFEEYHQSQFGGWPWPEYEQVHSEKFQRFAKYMDGSIEERDF